VGACACPDLAAYGAAEQQQPGVGYGQPYQDAASGLWYAQDASGQQYLWSGGGWVGANSPEATQVLADHLSGLLQQPEQLPEDQLWSEG